MSHDATTANFLKILSSINRVQCVVRQAEKGVFTRFWYFWSDKKNSIVHCGPFTNIAEDTEKG